MNFTNTDAVLARLDRHLTTLDEVHESDIIEWIGEALGFMNRKTMLEEHVTFIPVKNYQAELPQYFQMVLQVARDNNYDPSLDAEYYNDCYQEEIELQETPISDEHELPERCEVDFENIYEDQAGRYDGDYNARFRYISWVRSGFYKQRFTPLRLSEQTLFKSLVCREKDNSIYFGNVPEYTIIGAVDKVLRVSFRTGMVALSYLRTMLDHETNLPLIPDNEKALSAITYYVKWKIAERMVWSRKEGYKYLSEDNERKWNKYIKSFNSEAKMPKTLDEFQNRLENTHQLIPDHNRYYRFFGKTF